VKQYEHSWSERFERLDVVLEELKRNEEGDDGSDEWRDGHGDAPHR
jgi:hypothetical protein